MKWLSLAAVLVVLVQSRAVFADNVSAKISGGSLYVYGDGGDNNISIESTQAGSITVDGSPTTVNGGAAPVTLNGWNNGIFVYMGGGNDAVWFKSGDVLGATHFDLGTGDDGLLIGSPSSLPEEMLLDPLFQLLFPDPEVAPAALLRMRQTLTVLGFAGADQIVVTSCTVVGAATFDTAGGSDDIYLGTDVGDRMTYFQNNIVVVPGSEPDAVTMSEIQVSKNVTIDDPTHAATIDLVDSHVGGNLLVFTSLGVDNVSLTSLSVIGFVKAILKDGGDNFDCDGLRASQMELFLGTGNDRANVSNVKLTNLWAYLEDGSDKFTLDQSTITNSYYYGADGNDYFTLQNSKGTQAYVYGDGGTDTLKRTGNSIGNVYTFSIEHNL